MKILILVLVIYDSRVETGLYKTKGETVEAAATRLKPMLPTAREVIAHLMTTHIGIHLGQLSAWRRQMGMAAIS